MIQLGFDATQVKRIERSLQNPRFVQRVFSQQEWALISARPHPAQTAAAHFAAKEALSKALGCGLFGFALAEAAVLRRAGGAPYFELSGALAKTLQTRGLAAEVSLSHEGGFAFACVLLQPAQNGAAAKTKV